MPVLESVGRIGNPSHAGTRIKPTCGTDSKSHHPATRATSGKSTRVRPSRPNQPGLVSLPVTKAWLRQLVLGSGTGQ